MGLAQSLIREGGCDIGGGGKNFRSWLDPAKFYITDCVKCGVITTDFFVTLKLGLSDFA